MPWNGSGTFNRTNGVYSGAEVWKQSAAAGRNVRADDADTHDEDLATGLENCLTRDGQNRPSADLPMGGRKHTGVGDAEARDQYAALGQIQDGRPEIVPASGVGGTADAITLALSPAIAAYAGGQRFTFQVEAASTADVTINVSGLGAKDVYMQGATRAGAGVFHDNDFVTVLYTGSKFFVVGLPLGLAVRRNVGTAAGDLAALEDNGTFPPDTIPGLNADKITEGTLAADKIPGLNADKITAGTVGIGRLPRGTANGLASLDDNAHVPVDQLNDIPYAALEEDVRRILPVAFGHCTTGNVFTANYGFASVVAHSLGKLWTFTTARPNANYVVQLTVEAEQNHWVVNKTTTSFISRGGGAHNVVVYDNDLAS